MTTVQNKYGAIRDNAHILQYPVPNIDEKSVIFKSLKNYSQINKEKVLEVPREKFEEMRKISWNLVLTVSH